MKGERAKGRKGGRAVGLAMLAVVACSEGTSPPGEPVPLHFTALTVSTGATCALTAENALYCWGSGEGGIFGATTLEQCGPSQTPCSPRPLRIQTSVPLTTLSANSSTGSYVCGLDLTGFPYCWGTIRVKADSAVSLGVDSVSPARWNTTHRHQRGRAPHLRRLRGATGVLLGRLRRRAAGRSVDQPRHRDRELHPKYRRRRARVQRDRRRVGGHVRPHHLQPGLLLGLQLRSASWATPRRRFSSSAGAPYRPAPSLRCRWPAAISSARSARTASTPADSRDSRSSAGDSMTTTRSAPSRRSGSAAAPRARSSRRSSSRRT